MKVIYVDANNLPEFQKIAPNVAMALGYFDGVHLGHQKVIKQPSKRRSSITCFRRFSLSFHIPKVFYNQMLLFHIWSRLSKLKHCSKKA